MRQIFELSGLSQKALSRRLEEHACSGTNLSRLFTGKAALRLEHIVGISRALGFHPLEFFRIVFEEPEHPSPFLRRLADLIAPRGRQPTPLRPFVERDEFEKLLRKVAELPRVIEQLLREAQGQTLALPIVSRHPPPLAAPNAPPAANPVRTAQGRNR
ncbi:MAG TPA: helix-turn-helix transcriptional regulator [Thermoanaerobaculia bacterium]|nr:helix-turn-helix transcriptional regulator [Thermoanaerobaculia bacterium]